MEIAPREADEDVLQCHGTVSYLEDSRIVLVFLNEVLRSLGGQQLAMIDDGHAVADSLSLFHRMRGQQDAASILPEVLYALPELAARLRV